MNPQETDLHHYEEQLAQKSKALSEAFARYNPPTLEVFPSKPKHYRMRCEFRIWHEGDDLYYCMFDSQTKQKVRIDSFLPASELINEIMPALLDELRPNHSLRHKLFQVDFLSTLSGQILVSLLYHRQLDDNWIEQATAMKQRLSSRFKLDLVGRARKQKILLDRDYVMETLQVNGKALHYKQIENSFTQPNADVATKMLEWAIDTTKGSQGDLLELYCGNGNFSIALADNFSKVLATELAKPSVDAAQHNIRVNKVANLDIVRMSAEDFTLAMQGTKSFNRLGDIDLNSYQCNTIFVDPPRSGLDEGTVKLVQGYDNILYISCNPETLDANLQTLSLTHDIVRFALFDQFPYTHHTEAGVLLRRR